MTKRVYVIASFNTDQYRCTVSCKNQRHEIGLNYYALLGFWTMTVSNSSSMAIDIS